MERKVDRVDIATEAGVGEACIKLVAVARLDTAVAVVIHIVHAECAAQVIAADVFFGEFRKVAVAAVIVRIDFRIDVHIFNSVLALDRGLVAEWFA